MKFYNYLNENITEENIQFIKQNCQPFIKEYKKSGLDIDKKEFLLSGRRVSSYWSIKKIRKNRIPSDTPRIIHDWINDIMVENYGIKLRSQSLFCTGDYSVANGYGKVVYVIPIGKYKYFWHNNIKDLYGWIMVYKNDLISWLTGEKLTKRRSNIAKYNWNKNNNKKWDELTNQERKTLINDEYITWKKNFEKTVTSIKERLGGYKSTNLNKAIKSESEIMLYCDEVIMIGEDYINEIKHLFKN